MIAKSVPKPDWKDAPDWAKWLAMDANGIWGWYSNKPTIVDELDGEWFSDTGKWEEVSTSGWEKTLEKRPPKEKGK
ncbi:MAG TPA: hypothetical protein PL124_08570 [Candidatus Cloacimonadota bacterium]|nr:hypothetical protein [Candidatus Cloacimonadota bacterium]